MERSGFPETTIHSNKGHFMKAKTVLILLAAASNAVTAGDIDWSTSSMTPIDDTTIGVYDLDFAPTPEVSYNVNFIFNEATLNFEPDLGSLTVVDKTKYAMADLVRGGLLYDKWWKINDESEPTETYAWYPTEMGSQTGSATWRCKECHGWDYKGNEGAYESGSHYTGIEGLYYVKNKPVGEIYNAIVRKNLPLSEQDIWDLIKFMKEGLVDMNKYIVFSGAQRKSATGDADNGQTLYEGVGGCSNCHGADGNQISGLSVGAVANDNPWETLHKISFGHPGTQMPSMVDKELSLHEQVDILTYAQTLPQE
jgi:thiosulfate dehydrogenase